MRLSVWRSEIEVGAASSTVRNIEVSREDLTAFIEEVEEAARKRGLRVAELTFTDNKKHLISYSPPHPNKTNGMTSIVNGSSLHVLTYSQAKQQPRESVINNSVFEWSHKFTPPRRG